MKRALLIAGILTLLFSCGGNNSQSEKPDAKKLVLRWMEAHNQKSAKLFSSVYAEKVNYYGKVLDKNEVIEDKFGLFETAPDFHKELKGRIFEKVISPSLIQCTFYNKTSTPQSSDTKKKTLTFEKIQGKWLIVTEGGEKTTFSENPAISGIGEKTVTFKYDPSYSVVRGKIAFETFWGPPGYGKTPEKDEKDVCAILLPEMPVNVLAETEDNYTSNVYGVAKIQLVSSSGLNFKLYRKKNVRLTGKFFAPETGHHYTSVLMDVEMIEEI